VGIKETLTNDFTPRVTIVIVLLAMTGLWAWAFGKVPIPGDHGFVLRVQLAGDVQTIVGKDINDLKAASKETSEKVDNIKVALDQILADYYNKRVKDAVRQRCKLNPLETAERDRLWDQINKDWNLYRIYSGDRETPRPTCSDV
jgi:hypothetical protein